jgi:hypothetical protein
MKRLLFIAVFLFLGHFILTNHVDGSIYNEANSIVNNNPDFDNNGIIDFMDFEVIADNWLWNGQAGSNIADLDLNGTVDFYDFRKFASQWLYQKGSVTIFIDTNSYSNLQSEIERLKDDIENGTGSHVFIFPGKWGDIALIKEILKEKYNQCGLIGAIFIGDIPTAYFEYQNSGSTPSDWYFQDMSDNFIDSDGDGKFEREYFIAETDITMRDIWTGRLKPPLGRTDGIEMLRSYLDRNHKYRTGNLEFARKTLYYSSIAINQNGMTEQEYFDLISKINPYIGFYESDNDVNAFYETSLEIQKQIYLSELSKSYEFLFVNTHGTAVSQWLGGSTYIYYDEIKKAKPEALFSVLASCSNGDFTQDNYFAGWYLFSGDSLVVMANTVVTMLIGSNSPEFLKDYVPLGLGATFGQMCKNDSSFLVSDLFGDPTLTMRPKPSGELPHMIINQTNLQFTDTKRETKTTKFISFKNNGTEPLKVKFMKAPFSINDRWENLGYWDVFYYKHPETGSTFRDFEVPAGKSKNIPFVFYPREDAPDGKYSMTMLFQTNDPDNPYLEIHLVGNAI